MGINAATPMNATEYKQQMTSNNDILLSQVKRGASGSNYLQYTTFQKKDSLSSRSEIRKRAETHIGNTGNATTTNFKFIG